MVCKRGDRRGEKRHPVYIHGQGTVEAIKRDVPGARLSVPAVPLDLRSFASVKAFGASLRGGGLPAIDRLCLNAGRGGGKDDPRETTPDGHEAIMLSPRAFRLCPFSSHLC